MFYQALLKFKDKVDINIEGEKGGTALHIAAYYDHPEIAQILVSPYTLSSRPVICTSSKVSSHLQVGNG